MCSLLEDFNEAKPYGLRMPQESLMDSRLMLQKISNLHWAKQKN